MTRERAEKIMETIRHQWEERLALSERYLAAARAMDDRHRREIAELMTGAETPEPVVMPAIDKETIPHIWDECLEGAEFANATTLPASEWRELPNVINIPIPSPRSGRRATRPKRSNNSRTWGSSSWTGRASLYPNGRSSRASAAGSATRS